MPFEGAVSQGRGAISHQGRVPFVVEGGCHSLREDGSHLSTRERECHSSRKHHLREPFVEGVSCSSMRDPFINKGAICRGRELFVRGETFVERGSHLSTERGCRLPREGGHDSLREGHRPSTREGVRCKSTREGGCHSSRREDVVCQRGRTPFVENKLDDVGGRKEGRTKNFCIGKFKVQHK